MESYTCQGCGESFSRPPTKGQRPKWCPACRHPGGGQGSAPLACVVCGTVTLKSRAARLRGRPVCSPACRTVVSLGDRLPSRADFERETDRRHLGALADAKADAARDAADFARVVCVGTRGECAECGAEFLSPDRSGSARYCSPGHAHRHARRLAKARRRAREFGALVEEIDRFEVFDADGYECQLCGSQTDPEDYTLTDDGHFVAGPAYPSVDHVVPLALGGLHERSNVWTAHLVCNARKAAREAVA